ncbi:MAG: hypothetical protein IJZ94_01220 [Clostridia bacterium]|nr:hypothetical protein [Clostridia bacterium]
MKKFRIFSFILSLVLSVSICGCTKKDDENKDESKATLVNKNGQYYIQFDEIDKNINESFTNSVTEECITFSSMDEFYSKVTNVDFSEEEVDIMFRSFPNDDNGIRVCDMDRLYQPILPNDAVVDNVRWYGDAYVTSWVASDGASGSIQVFDREEDFYRIMNALRPDNFYEKEHVEVLDYSEDQNSKYTMKKWTFTTTTDSGQYKFREEQYETDSADSHCKIIIIYRLESNDKYSEGMVFSDTIPHRLHVFGNNGDKYWINDSISIVSDIDIDWLMSFDIEPYVAE